MKHLFVTIVFLILKIKLFSQPSDIEVVRKIADRIIENTKYCLKNIYTGDEYTKVFEIPNDTIKVTYGSSYIEWHYVNGVINLGMVDLGTYLKDNKYIQHCINFIYYGLENYKYFEKLYNDKKIQDVRKIPFREIFLIRELDDCGAIGASAIEAYYQKPTPELKEYIFRIADHILNKQDRIKDKTLVRKGPFKMTVWADDLYMSVPFLARMGKFSGDKKYYDDAILQVINFNKYLWNNDKGLYYHCYYNDLKRNGVAHWGRCNGWVMMATVNLLSFLPQDYPRRETIRQILEKHILGIAKYQNKNGLWHQVLDKNDSYEESSCSAMFVFSIAKAVNEGWIDKRYASIALAGWEGLKKYMITEDGQLKNVCIGTGIQDNLVFYYNRPAVLNDSHGLGAILEAGVEIIKLKENLKK